jgi:site-specific recombinase XerC
LGRAGKEGYMVPTDQNYLEDLEILLPSWRRHLRARNFSPKTITAYLSTAERFLDFLKAAGMPTSTVGIRREHVEAYIEDQLIRHMPSTAATRYRDLKQLFGWLVDEGEISQHPMARMRPPRLNESSIPLIADSDIRRLLEVCSGRSFNDRRDTAIMFVFIDTGARLAEIAGLKVDVDVDFDFDELHVTGKGRRDRGLPMGGETRSKRSTAICANGHVTIMPTTHGCGSARRGDSPTRVSRKCCDAGPEKQPLNESIRISSATPSPTNGWQREEEKRI